MKYWGQLETIPKASLMQYESSSFVLYETRCASGTRIARGSIRLGLVLYEGPTYI